MHYIYHGVPDSMVGNQLVPLTTMHKMQPELAAKYLQKYEGREEILERRVPLLDCLWNDVIQFLPYNPQKVFELQVKLGLIPAVPPYRFYQIDLSLLDPAKTAVFFKNAPGDENVVVKWLSDIDFDSIQDIPKPTLDYYKTLVGTGELPFNYQFVPHILYMGSLDISSAQVVSLK